MQSKHNEAVSGFVKALASVTEQALIESISEPYDMQKNWPDPWPNNMLAGAYLLFSDSYELLYVGKASLIGRRLMAHFQYSADRKSGVAVDTEASGTRYIVTVGLHHVFSWLAPSLEEYLIANLKPNRNKIGNF